MKICVEVDLGGAPAAAVASEVRKNWALSSHVISPKEDIPADAEGLLVIGEGRKDRPTEGLLILDRIERPSGALEQTLFQVNAKLGRMTRSDLLRTKVAVQPAGGKDKLSRRDLLFGLRGGFQTYSDAPTVFESICEAKYGCSKCVDACPSKALRFDGPRVVVNESECTRAGECAAVCPVSAIQLPKYSEEAFLGLLDGLSKTAFPRKVLVIACERSSIDPQPWTYVDRVKDVGRIGARQLAVAAASGLAGVVVYCADGLCAGAADAGRAARAVSAAMNVDGDVLVEFLQGQEGRERIREIQASLVDRRGPALSLGRDAWGDYVRALQSLSRAEAGTPGLGVTDLRIDDTCTLCGNCAKSCPHVALRMGSGTLELDSARCTGCGYCARVCPETSITLQPLRTVADFAPRIVFRDVIVNCARCGKPLESAGLLRKVAAMVGKEDPMMKYCSSCKQILALEGLSKSEPGKGPG